MTVVTTHTHYIPETIADKNNWLINFNLKLPTFATALGITPAQLGVVDADTLFFTWVVIMVLAFKKNFHERVVFRNHLANGTTALGPIPTDPALPTTPPIVGPGIFDRVQLLVRTIKAHANYSESIGIALGIIGDETITDTQFIKPILEASLLNEHPKLKYGKLHMEGIHVYADYDGTGFKYIGTTTHATFVDTHPLPAAGQTAVWKYNAKFILHELEVGVYSDNVHITVTGV